jgi:prepilin-type processing-associated H-X9-DG protein
MPNPPTIDYGRPEPRKPSSLYTWLTLLAIVLLLLSIIVPTLARLREQSSYLPCPANLRGIGQALYLYAADHAGHYPPDLQTVFATQPVTPSKFICPSTSDAEPSSPSDLSLPNHCSYIYVGANLTTQSNPVCIVALEDPANHAMESVNVLFADGHVESFELTFLMQSLNDLAAGKNPPAFTTTFTQATARQDYNQHWKSRMPQLKTGVWLIPTTQPATLPSAR